MGTLGQPKGPLERLLTDGYFRVQGTDDIFAIGDCSRMAEQDLPPTAQVAQQQGKVVAKYLNRRMRSKETRPFRYKHVGMMAYIGNNRALADMKNVRAAASRRGFSGGRPT